MKYILLALLLIGCSDDIRKPLKEEQTKNGYEVSFLFEHDGYKVYRFYDSRDHYFVKCQNNNQVVENQAYRHGKTTSIESENIPSYNF